MIDNNLATNGAGNGKSGYDLCGYRYGSCSCGAFDLLHHRSADLEHVWHQVVLRC